MIEPNVRGMLQKHFSTFAPLLFAAFVLTIGITLISIQPKSAFAIPPVVNDNITIIKQTDPDGSPQVFNFTSSLGSFSLSDGQNITFTGLSGGIYTFTETVPFGWNSTVPVTCVGIPAPDTSGSQMSIEFPGAVSESAVCTFHNQKLPTGNITVAKETIPDGNPEKFNFTGNLGDFTLGDGQNMTFTMPIGFYGFSETDMPLGWAGTTVECSDSGGIISSREFTTSQIPHAGIQLNASDAVTCTFTNEIVLGNITIIKQTNPDNSTQLFNFTGSLGSFTLGDGQNVTFTVPSGNYSVNEIVPAGWNKNVDRSCNFPNADGSSASIVGLNSMSISLVPNGVVECTFNNQELGKIIVEKQTIPDGAAGSFNFTGDAAGTISDNGTIVVSNLLPGNYSTTEVDPAPFILTNIACNDTNSFWNVTARTATFVLEPGEVVKCTFTDTNVLVVDIDIKPGSDPNAINLKKDRIITVAILGNATFNVNNIDVSPLSDAPKFGGTTPKAPVRVSYQDVNKDGFTDLVLQYKLAQLGFTSSSTEGCITGKLTDGTIIEGCDSVTIVPK